ncbi:GNAT family N-acetyltransferase [Kitasatospora kifunensis]|uniref:GNAT superfamily N-acetyltransferase n=1 Tax=Kitasatospora kifunensis TaxID=58351 RepID=A0A7W7W0A9_KITKI|nr:GNAT family N-acetyltransferase [Kitasatospora kifunensis]MBB4928978.1 GNAT superfamily N-acetyltransferase [Kitasatospora kifunensis]
MLIRAAQLNEAEILSELALRSKAHWGYDEEFLAACQDELSIPASEVESLRTVVAEQGGRILGFATLEGNPPEGALGMLFVEPDAIGQGIGRRLFEHVTASARTLGFQHLTIDADPNAEPFYLAMGATRIGSTPSASIPGRTLPLLRITLTEHMTTDATSPC